MGVGHSGRGSMRKDEQEETAGGGGHGGGGGWKGSSPVLWPFLIQKPDPPITHVSPCSAGKHLAGFTLGGRVLMYPKI